MSVGLTAFTIFHVVISLIGIVTGIVVVLGMLSAKRLDGWTAIFLATTALTSVTGFLFPVHHLMPSHVLGIISLVVLVPAIVARYPGHLAGAYRWIFVVTAVMALYFNVFVLVVQLFLKVPALHSLAPTQNEPPFKITQLVVLAAFVGLGIAAVLRFHPPQPQGQSPQTQSPSIA
jgi:hypothetical protein